MFFPGGQVVTGATEKVRPLLGEVGICPDLTYPVSISCPWGTRPYWGDSRDAEGKVPESGESSLVLSFSLCGGLICVSGDPGDDTGGDQGSGFGESGCLGVGGGEITGEEGSPAEAIVWVTYVSAG